MKRLLLLTVLTLAACTRSEPAPAAALPPQRDLKREYVEMLAKTAERGSEPWTDHMVYGNPGDPCGEVVAVQGGFQFTGRVCCDIATERCQLRWNRAF